MVHPASLVCVGLLSLFAAVGLPDIASGTDYSWLEDWTRVGCAGLAMLILFSTTVYVGPRREREHDKTIKDTIDSVVAGSVENMKTVVASAEKAHERVCEHLTELKTTIESGKTETNDLLREALSGVLQKAK